jgi:predicted GNAT family acetyltransferase
MEALGAEEAIDFIRMMERDFRGHNLACFDGTNLHQLIQAFLHKGKTKIYLPLSLYSAIDQYQEWYRMNPLTTPSAREQTIFELLELFRLQGIPEYGRYFFYRHTFFSDSEETVQAALDKLLLKLQERQGGLAIQLMELSELQSALHDPLTISVFTRMVFPKLESGTKVDIVKVPKTDAAQVVVRFSVVDKAGQRYTLREPLEPKETGQLYQLFFKEKYPKEISDQDHQYILTDEQSRIVGGLTYRHIEDNNILLDGIVVSSVLQGKGLASAMMEKFFASMAAQGVEVVRAHFLFGNYYMKHLFEVDKKWGALIKRLNE